MQCPGCGAELTEIVARHDYILSYSGEQEKWVKDIGRVTYSCGNCSGELDTHDIAEALEQTDEL